MTLKAAADLQVGDKIKFKKAHPEPGKRYTYLQSGKITDKRGNVVEVSRSTDQIRLTTGELERDPYYSYNGKSLKTKLKELIT